MARMSRRASLFRSFLLSIVAGTATYVLIGTALAPH